MALDQLNTDISKRIKFCPLNGTVVFKSLGANVINKLKLSVAWLCYATLKIVYDFGSWLKTTGDSFVFIRFSQVDDK